jgi:hypothetical protein
MFTWFDGYFNIYNGGRGNDIYDIHCMNKVAIVLKCLYPNSFSDFFSIFWLGHVKPTNSYFLDCCNNKCIFPRWPAPNTQFNQHNDVLSTKIGIKWLIN